MVEERTLAVPETTIFIAQLPVETQHIIREDLRQHAREHGYQLEWDREAGDYVGMTRRFCDMEDIYNGTNLHFCEPGEDVEIYERSMQRKIVLKIPEEDVKSLCRKAGRVGLSVSDLLENFVADLVGSDTRSNGSDERMYADSWFDRCWFSIEPDQTFLSYLMDWYSVSDTVSTWDTLKELRQLDEPDEYDKEEIEYLTEEINELFKAYQETCRYATDKAVEEGMEKVLKWNEEREALLESCVMEKSKER